MVKLAGIIMIISSGTMLGFSKSMSLKKRQESLGMMIYSLRIMENEISYGRCSMDDIFAKITRLGGIVVNMEKGSAGTGLISSARSPALCLDKEDVEVIARFCGNLGACDSISQLKNIKNTVKSLEILEETARLRYDKYGRMYRSIGVLASIFAVIVLI